jgi:hypothetical protein
MTTLTHTQITAGTISPPLSDHLPIYAIFHKPLPRQKKDSIKTLSKYQYIKQKDNILSTIKTAISRLDTSDPTTTTTQHFADIQHALTDSIEQYEKTPNRRNKPWCKPKYRQQIRKQHRLYKKKKNNPTPANIKAHAQYRNKLNKTILQAKREHIAELLEKTRKDPRKQATILKTIIPGKGQPRTSPTTILYQNQTYTDPKDIANALNDHYITIGHKTSETIPHHQQHDSISTPKIHHPPFILQPTTLDVVTDTMNKINPNKARDIFKITPAILKDLTPFISPILTELYNRAISEHKYPDSLKITKVIEIYKNDDKTWPKSYRPISLLPIIAKILDTIINKQLMHHLTKHNIISPTQYAFRPDSSTTLALQTILNDIHKHKFKWKPTLAIYIDLSKAYDTISHSKLLHKLRHDFNFSENTVKFFKSYFHNRQQSTHTQNAQSRMQTITHGIPQGSTLSTTFFLLYINDIINTVQSKVYTYADDTTLVITAANKTELQELAQKDINSIIHYFHANNLVPNAKKTNYTTFHPRDEDIELQINETSLKKKTEARLLGLMVQSNLKYNKTITNIIQSLQPLIQILRYARQLLPTYKMKELYFTHIYPYLIGNIAIWGTENAKKTYIQPLIRLQKQIIRIIMNKRYKTHTTPLFARLNILKLTNLYILRVCVEMHSFIYTQSQQNRPQHHHIYTWSTQTHEHKTRYSLQQNLSIPNKYTHRYSKSKVSQQQPLEHFNAQYSSIWNSIPLPIREVTSKDCFKRKLKAHLLSKQEKDT